MIRTKIVATLGPATSSLDMLLRMIQEGLDVVRFNFSHGSLEDHAQRLTVVREASRQAGVHLAVLGDLCGPKIRLGAVADTGGTGGMPIGVGDTLAIQRSAVTGAAGRVSCTYEPLIDEAKPGDRVLIEDGLLRFLVTEKRPDELLCTCTVGGVLKTGKGINLPDTTLSVNAITDRDWECARWAMANDLDYLALSFVRRADELLQLRKALDAAGSPIQIIAKIEKAEAVEQIDQILAAADGLMVARGDLGVEMDVARVPIIQKDLVRRCQAAGKPVIVATQMLQSMIDQASPTRAEVSDVANAIMDGTDAVMLSGETAVGKYPAAAVHMMNHIATVTEAYLASLPAPGRPAVPVDSTQLSTAVARGVWRIVNDIRVKLVVIWCQTGTTARIFSNQRLPVPMIAMSSDPRALRRMALDYGTIPVRMDVPKSVAEMIGAVDRILIERKWALTGDRAILVAGSSLGVPGTMNGIVIHTVGQDWVTVTDPAMKGAEA